MEKSCEKKEAKGCVYKKRGVRIQKKGGAYTKKGGSKTGLHPVPGIPPLKFKFSV